MPRKKLEPLPSCSYTASRPYDASYHPGRVYEIWCMGHAHVPKICKELQITELILKQWIAVYPDFREQFDLGRVVAKANWFDYACEHMSDRFFQPRLFEQMMGTFFHELREDRPISFRNLASADTLEKKINAALALMESGDFSVKEIASLTTSLKVIAEMGSYEKIRSLADKMQQHSKTLGARTSGLIEGDVYNENEENK